MLEAILSKLNNAACLQEPVTLTDQQAQRLLAEVQRLRQLEATSERGHYYSEAESGWDAQPTAKDALQAIANLPTGKNESEMNGQEEAYRAVEALFVKPPYVECMSNEYAKGVRAGIDEALRIAREQAALMADLAVEGLPESARNREAMEAALTRFSTKLSDTLAALRTAPATQAVAVTDGYVLVPKQPTREMQITGREALESAEDVMEAGSTYVCDFRTIAVWYAMIAASPAPTGEQK